MSTIWIVLKTQTRAMSIIWSVLFSQTRGVCTIWTSCSIQHQRVSAHTIPVSFFFLLICHILSTLQGQYTFASRVQQSIAYESFTTKRRMDLLYLSIDRLHESRLSTQPLKVHCSQSDRYTRVIFISNRILSQPQLLK